MSLTELFLIAAGLSMDAFAASVCKGLAVQRADLKKCMAAGLYFGGFQALMPLAGFLLGTSFKDLITSIDHWIAFILLLFIGAGMIKEAFTGEEEPDSSFGFKSMLPLAVGTSIDALAVGISFAFLSVDIVPAVLLIGVTTFAFSFAGVKIGNRFGERYKSKAEITGGLILICIGLKILLEHLGII